MDDSDHREHSDASVDGESHGWKKVTYSKSRKNQQQQLNKSSDNLRPSGTLAAAAICVEDSNVFQAIEEQSVDRRRRLESQNKAAVVDDAPKARSKRYYEGDSSDDSEVNHARGNVVVEEKKEKKAQKKEKRPKVNVSDAASKIDSADLADFLSEVSDSYGYQEEIQLMRFADYFGRAFSGVGAAQFPWVKIFRESTVAKIAEIPLCLISDAVYKTSSDWINQHSYEALNSFVLCLLDSILTDLTRQLTVVKGSKKHLQPPSSKSQVAMFIVLAVVLRQKPDVLVNVLPSLRENSKYHGQDKLPVIIWMISQACQGDLAVGLYLWAHYLLPMISNKSSNNPLSRDLILQAVERILSAPQARSILVNGAVRKGERLIPPSSFEILVQVTFPASSARLKATERFEAVYPTLKEVALAGSPGSKAMKLVTQRILSFSIKAAGEGIPELSKEAEDIFIWCLAQNNDCYKQWDKIYLDNMEASVAVLRKLSDEWKQLALNQASSDCLKDTLRSFQKKTEKELPGEDAARQALFSDAIKYCKIVLGRLSRGHSCLKSMVLIIVAFAVGAAVVSPSMESFDWRRVSVMLSSFQSH
ncbi:hypothetical protein Nepgr_003817 [Nepenthes gracilis]|uniref:Transmembrane protein 214-A n=1 Tax=Nepenthes gracilis TaxID=150966 RepID=A0AAD3XE80_NEPGR|nr:hypothetical protein Nepgr_003817 [Nepenthes gracilis]